MGWVQIKPCNAKVSENCLCSHYKNAVLIKQIPLLDLNQFKSFFLPKVGENRNTIKEYSNIIRVNSILRLNGLTDYITVLAWSGGIGMPSSSSSLSAPSSHSSCLSAPT